MKVTIDFDERVLIIDGVRCTPEALVDLLNTTPDGRWYRFERKGNEVIVHTRQDPA